VEPQYNEGPGNWQNMFALMRFHCNEVSLKNIIHYTEGFVTERFVKLRFHCITISMEEFVFIQFVVFVFPTGGQGMDLR